MSRMLRVAAAALLAGCAMHADAAILLYQLQGADASKYSASFTLDTTRTPSIVLSNQSVRYNGVPFTYTNPNSSTVQTAALSNSGPTFMTLGFQGGFYLGSFGVFPYGFSVYGPQLFTGPTSAPTFLTGTFDLSDVSRNRTSDPLQVNYTLTVTDITNVGAVPEPASWAMLTAGFGLLGAAMRRRRTLLATTI